MTHTHNSYLVLGMRIPEHLDADEVFRLRRVLASKMAEVSHTTVEDNLGAARELIVAAYTAGDRIVYAGLRIEGSVH